AKPAQENSRKLSFLSAVTAAIRMQSKVNSNFNSPRTVSALVELMFRHPAYREASESLTRGAHDITISGVTSTAKSLITAGLARELAGLWAREDANASAPKLRPLVVITADNQAADRLAETTSTFLEWLEGPDAASHVGVLPAFDCSPYDQRSPHPEIAER